jgi:hypothetical protein
MIDLGIGVVELILLGVNKRSPGRRKRFRPGELEEAGVIGVSWDDHGAVIVEVGGMKTRSVIHTRGQRTPSCGHKPIKVPRTDRYRFRYGSLNDAKRGLSRNRQIRETV